MLGGAGRLVGVGELAQMCGQDPLDLRLVFAHRLPPRGADRQLRGGVEQPAATKAVGVGRLGVIEVGVEDGQDCGCGAAGLSQSRSIQRQPFLVPGVEIGRRQRVLGLEVVVQAHLGDPGARDDRIDPGRGHPVGIEELGRGLQQPVTRRGGAAVHGTPWVDVTR